MPEKPFAFVLMPFHAEMEDVYRLGIKAAVEESGMIAERVDEQVFHREGILDRIYNQIGVADLIIADMSGRNPNVFYEVGYAHARDKLCILLTDRSEDIPFDLKHHRHIVYNKSIQRLKTSLLADLQSIKGELAKRENPVFVEIKQSKGILSKTRWIAKGNLDFTIDLHNRTQYPSPEIDSIFFYAGNRWTFRQDGNECPSTTSDIKGFGKRFLLRSPTRRLVRNGWAQIRLNGERILGMATKGEELKDIYKISGKIFVRILAADHIYDYPISMETVFDEIPF